MPLPEIPDSWSKFVNLLVSAVAAIAASLALIFSHSNGTKIDDGVRVVTQKQDANADKLDATDRKVYAIERKAAEIHDTAEKTAEKVGAKK